MPLSTTRLAPRRLSGGDRVFAADDGQLWSASLVPDDEGSAVVFACITDSRRPVRAVAAEPDRPLRDVVDDTLRAWLRSAPRIGRLT